MPLVEFETLQQRISQLMAETPADIDAITPLVAELQKRLQQLDIRQFNEAEIGQYLLQLQNWLAGSITLLTDEKQQLAEQLTLLSKGRQARHSYNQNS